MTKNKQSNQGKNWSEPEALSGNFQGKKPKDASAPKVEGNPYTPSTSQSNIRGPQGR